jgi:hypothetical protein
MVKPKGYSAFIWLHNVVKSVKPPTAIRKMISDLFFFFVTNDLTVPFHNLSAHCKLTVAHSTSSADILNGEGARRIFARYSMHLPQASRRITCCDTVLLYMLLFARARFKRKEHKTGNNCPYDINVFVLHAFLVLDTEQGKHWLITPVSGLEIEQFKQASLVFWNGLFLGYPRHDGEFSRILNFHRCTLLDLCTF